VVGDGPDALGVGHRRAAELLDEQRHGGDDGTGRPRVYCLDPMPTDKRQRQKEARLARLEAERRAAKRAATRKRLITGVVIAALVFAVLAAISFVGGDDDGDDGEVATVERRDKPEIELPDPIPTELEIEDLIEGEGQAAQLGDQITVDYVGVLAKDGTEFDASFGNPEPATFPLTEGGLIDGWIQGIPGMKVGGRRMLTIPAELAYGETGSGPDIGPNEPLVFVIDLIDTVSPGQDDPPPAVDTGS
jgi:peptidylprolyl isomerase